MEEQLICRFFVDARIAYTVEFWTPRRAGCDEIADDYGFVGRPGDDGPIYPDDDHAGAGRW